MTWLWYTVRRQDRPEYRANTARYLAAMLVSIVVIAISAVLPTDARLIVWAAFSAGWLVLMLVFGWMSRRGSVTGIVPTDAMVERFDLLIIIVLGEVVTGVVNGLAGAEHDAVTLATGLRGARGRLRPVVDLLRRRRAPPAALRRAGGQPVDGRRTCRSRSRSSGPGPR